MKNMIKASILLIVLLSAFLSKAQMANRLSPLNATVSPGKAQNFMYVDLLISTPTPFNFKYVTIDSVLFNGFHVVKGLNDSIKSRYTKTQSNNKFYLASNPNGYISSYTETDPLFSISAASAITTTNTSNWNTAFGWGNHVGLYPLLSGSYNNPTWITGLNWTKISSTPTTLSGYGITNAYPLTGNPSNFLTSFTEVDPIWISDKPSYSTKLVADGLYKPIAYSPAITGGGISTISQSGSSFTITSTEVDGSISNELQNLSINSNTISISSGNSITIPVYTLTSLTASTGISITSGSTITNTLPNITPTIVSVNSGTITSSNSSFTLTQKRQETFTGTTNASGVVTFTFSAYSAVPNIQYTGGFGTTNKETIIPNAAPTTTSCSFYVQARTDVVGLLPSYSNVSGREVNILVTEK